MPGCMHPFTPLIFSKFNTKHLLSAAILVERIESNMGRHTHSDSPADTHTARGYSD